MTTRTATWSASVLALALALGPSPAAFAADGFSGFTGGSYYESVQGSGTLAAMESPEPGHPTQLMIEDASATLRYTATGGANGTDWAVSIDDFSRSHERVEALYDLVLVVPVPVHADGSAAHDDLDGKIPVFEVVEQGSIPLVYDGEAVVLKRNVALEKSLLPDLIGSGSDKLPSLEGTGYTYAVWDAIVEFDALWGEVIQAEASFGYTTSTNVVAPDASDERMKGYLITWVPTLGAAVPPYTLRFDLTDSNPDES